MESGQLRKLNLCYAGIQSLYWAGFAAIWAFLSVLLLYRGFSNSQIGTVSALALLMPLAVQPVLASLADRDRRFTSRRLAMALTGLLLLCAVGLWCSAGSMAVTAALYVLVGISLTATAPFHSAMAMELQQHGVALNYGLSRGLGSACYAASVLVLGVVVERYAPTAVLPVFAGEMLLLLLLTWRFRASPTAAAAAGSGPVLSVGQLLRRYPAYTWLLVGCALLMACHSATCTYMIHIVGKVGGSESMMGSALAVAAFLELPAMGLFSRVRRKVPLAWLLIFCAAFFVIRAGLFWAARSVPVLYLAAALARVPGSHAAGFFYCRIADPTVQTESRIREEVERQIAKKLALSGISLSDVTILRAQGGQQAAMVTKDGKPNGRFAASMVDEAGMEKLLTFARNKAAALADEIYAGEIDDSPVERETFNACQNCEYSAICVFDPLRKPRRRLTAKRLEDLT